MERMEGELSKHEVEFIPRFISKETLLVDQMFCNMSPNDATVPSYPTHVTHVSCRKMGLARISPRVLFSM